jgi:putative ABC transport system permease protein
MARVAVATESDVASIQSVGRKRKARKGHAFGVAWYRIRVTFRRQKGRYVALALVVGALGGIAMGATVAARRTQSSFSRYLASTNPSQLTAATFTNGSYDPVVVRRIGDLAGVRRVESVADIDVAVLGPDGAPSPSTRNANGKVLSFGSVNGLYFNQDRPRAIQGRMSDPDRSDEVVMTKDAASLLGLHVGETVRLGVYANLRRGLSRLASVSAQPVVRVDVTVVGIVVFNDGVVRDDAFRFPTYVLFTPAFVRPFMQCCTFATVTGVQVDAPSRDAAAVEAAVEGVLPEGSTFYVRSLPVVEAQVARADRPASVALGIFGAVAALTTLVLGVVMIGRQLSSGTEDRLVLRALGASPIMTVADGALGTIGAITGGALLAAALGVALSAFAPLSAARSVDPGAGVSFDWTVLLLGTLTLIVTLSAFAMFYAYRQAQPRRAAARSAAQMTSTTRSIQQITATSFPVSCAEGIRFAIESKRRGNPIPAWVGIAPAVVSMTILIGTLIFAANLRELAATPARQGWNWDYELSSQFGGSGNIPLDQASRLLDDRPDVDAWTGVYFDAMRVDAVTIPILGATPGAVVAPPALSGRTLQASDQIVLGATTLAELHKHVGETVEVHYATVTKSARLRIVGTATMPPIGPGGGLHLSMGTGAIVPYQLIPPNIRNGGGTRIGPNAILVRTRHNLDAASSNASMNQIATALSSTSNGSVFSLRTQRPAELTNYQSVRVTLGTLAGTLAAGAAIALALTLGASVRARRLELAIFKALGSPRRQLAAVVAWQATAIVLIGIAIGIPLGVIVGQSLWQQFANALHVKPITHIPTSTVVLIALLALVLANTVAALPARQAANTRVTTLLNAE